MLKKIIVLLTLTSLALFTGCIDSETIVKVKPNGSGEIHETVLLSAAVAKMFSGMQASMGGSDSDTKKPGFYDEEKLKKGTSKYGDGVTYVSSQEVKTDKGEGYKVIYAFNNINNIKLDQNPGGKVGGASPEKNVEENMAFKMEKGKISTLKINMNNSKKSTDKSNSDTNTDADTKADVDSAATKMMAEQMMKMFDGMRVRIAIEIDGDIVKTNATHRDGNKLTLLDMDFAKLLKDEEAFKTFSKSNPKTIAETKELIKNVEGMKIDFNDELVVKFK